MGKYVLICYAGENCLNITGKRMGFYDYYGIILRCSLCYNGNKVN